MTDDDAEVSGEVNGDIAGQVSSEVNADIATQRFEPYDWQRSLSAAAAAHAEKTARRQAERAELQRRRNHGKATLHRNKLAHLNRRAIPTDQTGGQQ